mgnify:CR=1 FL=1|jgi:hypothetical protein
MSAPPGAELWARFEARGARANLVVSCGCYMVSSAGMSVFNKLAVQALDLPISLVLIQMLFTVASIAVRPNSVHIGSMRDALRWGLSVPMLFAAMLVRPRHAHNPYACGCWPTGPHPRPGFVNGGHAIQLTWHDCDIPEYRTIVHAGHREHVPHSHAGEVWPTCGATVPGGQEVPLLPPLL